MSHYVKYYENQAGGGRGVKNVFAGSTYQRGSGIKSFLGGLLRKIVPYLASESRAIDKEALRTGMHVLQDGANDDVNFEEAANNRVPDPGKVLKNKAAK